MQLVSVAQASHLARRALQRFPLVLLAGFGAAGIAFAMIQRSGDQPTLLRALLAATLGLPLGAAIEATSERRRWSSRWLVASRLAAAAALAAFAVLSRDWPDRLLWTRYAQLSVVFHLLAAVSPFGGGAAQRGFWQYNRFLFQRFLLASLYAGVLFAALSVALLASDKLLGFDVGDKTYGRLAALLAFVFQPWFFLGGLPDPLASLEDRDDYPGAMKVFAQFILIPVVTVYLAILTAYLGRVVVTRTWPSGWIGWLVSSVATAGTLALLLVHPIRERADSRWVDFYGRWFYVALLPSIAMLLAAIQKRVHQYGVTESRYVLAIVAFWLAGIAVYYGVTGSRSIRRIPVTLCLVALAIFAGPWSATAVARRSQVDRLRTLLLRNDLLADGRTRRATRVVAEKDRREIGGAVRYLVEAHGPNALAVISPDLRDTALRPVEKHRVASAVLDTLGIQEAAPLDATGFIGYVAPSGDTPLVVTGYNVLVRRDLVQPFTVPVGGDTLGFTLAPETSSLAVSRGGRIALEVSLAPAVESARAASPPVRDPNLSPLVVEAQGGGIRLRIWISSLHARPAQGRLEAGSIQADVLIGVD